MYEQNGPITQTQDLTIQTIEFTFTHDRLLDQAIQMNKDKYNPLIDGIRARSWKIKPLIVITARVRRAIHTKGIEILENLHISHTSYLIRENLTLNKKRTHAHVINIYIKIDIYIT
jgi:hypothetical protein